MIGGFDAFEEAVEVVFGGFEFADDGDVGFGWDFDAEAPVDAVDDEAAEVFADEVGGGAHGGAEDFVFAAFGVGDFAEPGDGHHGCVDVLGLAVVCAFLFVGGGAVGGVHAFEDHAAEEDGGVCGWVDFVDVGVAEDVLDVVEDGVFGVGLLDDAAAGFDFVAAPVADPAFAEDVFAELAVLFEGAAAGELEGVGAGAEADDGDVAVDGVVEVFECGVRPFAEAEGHDDGVGGVEGFWGAEAFAAVGVDGAIVIDGEEDGAFEAVVLAEEFAEHGEGLFGAVFLVAGEEDDVFAGAGAFAAGVGDPAVSGFGEGGDEGGEEEGG